MAQQEKSAESILLKKAKKSPVFFIVIFETVSRLGQREKNIFSQAKKSDRMNGGEGY